MVAHVCYPSPREVEEDGRLRKALVNSISWTSYMRMCHQKAEQASKQEVCELTETSIGGGAYIMLYNFCIFFYKLVYYI